MKAWEATAILDDELRAATECRLITAGRRSGQPRHVRLWFAAADDRLFALAGSREQAHWVRNLQANPEVVVRIGKRTFEGRAGVIEGTADDPVAREALGARYGTKWLTRWLRESLPVAIDVEREIG